jgi:hypothetical protein
MAIMNARRRPSPLVIAVEAMPFFRNDARAACADRDNPDIDPEMWFKDGKVALEAVRPICNRCPLYLGCREWALTHREHGIWGGLDERARNAHMRAAA